MANIRHRIVLGISVTLLGAALFELASAYIVDRGYGKIAAAIVGAVAFPVVPGLWQLVGERRRRARLAAAKKPSTSTLTAGDRYWMRFVVVALVVLGPMFAIGRFKVLGATWRHGLWFIPESSSAKLRDFKAEDHLLKRVPGDAELVVVFHQDAKAGSAVVGWGGKQAVIAADGSLDDGEPIDKKLDDLNAKRDKLPWLGVDKLSQIPTEDQTLVIATDAWKDKVAPGTGPSDELMGELRRAPQDAVFVAAFAPRTKLTLHDIDPDTIRHGVVWATMDDKALVIAGRIDMKDVAAGAKLLAEANDVLQFKTDDLPAACKEPVGKIVDRIHLEQNGTILTGRAEIPTEALMGLMFCAIK
ncbi:MAG: hypothetical protein ACM31C_02995 [Acidobacteriota bacterium]